MQDNVHLEVDVFGNKRYFKNFRLHRTDGPAYEGVDGSRYWLIDDQFHRFDGPAIETGDGKCYWFLFGKKVKVSSQKEFEKHVKMLIFSDERLCF